MEIKADIFCIYSIRVSYIISSYTYMHCIVLLEAKFPYEMVREAVK